MIKHRAAHQWDHWLPQPLGQRLLKSERQVLASFLKTCRGQRGLLIGVPKQSALLHLSQLSHQVLLSPLINKYESIHQIEGDFHQLPIASASFDLVLLPHTLEYIDNPYQVLTEACRVVKPEGHIIILGFNPYSLWGLRKKCAHSTRIPWSSNFVPAIQVKKWLKLADFELEKFDSFFFRPPLQSHGGWFQKLKIMETLGRKLWYPWGGVYIVRAKAKLIPLTPIRLRWQQKLSGVNISLPRPIIRSL